MAVGRLDILPGLDLREPDISLGPGHMQAGFLKGGPDPPHILPQRLAPFLGVGLDGDGMGDRYGIRLWGDRKGVPDTGTLPPCGQGKRVFRNIGVSRFSKH